MKKIFAVLDSKDVYGKELSNIEVCCIFRSIPVHIPVAYKA